MGLPSNCPAPLTCPSTLTSFHFWAAATPPTLMEIPSWALEEERIWASWLPHSLQLPGFLIDGDYYIIDLLDRTVPALGTLCPLSEACPRAWHQPHRACRPALPASPAPPPAWGGRPLGHLPRWPWDHVLGWGRRQAGSPTGAQQVSGSACGVWLYQRLFRIVGPTWPPST